MNKHFQFLDRSGYAAPEIEIYTVLPEKGFAGSGYGEEGRAGAAMESYDILNSNLD